MDLTVLIKNTPIKAGQFSFPWLYLSRTAKNFDLNSFQVFLTDPRHYFSGLFATIEMEIYHNHVGSFLIMVFGALFVEKLHVALAGY